MNTEQELFHLLCDIIGYKELNVFLSCMQRNTKICSKYQKGIIEKVYLPM